MFNTDKVLGYTIDAVEIETTQTTYFLDRIIQAADGSICTDGIMSSTDRAEAEAYAESMGLSEEESTDPAETDIYAQRVAEQSALERNDQAQFSGTATFEVKRSKGEVSIQNRPAKPHGVQLDLSHGNV